MASSNLQKRRRELRSDLSTIEKQIYDLETHYLEETRDVGNILSGWDMFLSNDKVKIKKQVSREERLFSLSSSTSPATKRDLKVNKEKERGEKNIEKEKEKEKEVTILDDSNADIKEDKRRRK